MKTYIFSNCSKSNYEEYGRGLLDKIPLDGRIVILNRGDVYYKVPEFLKYKNQNILLRAGEVRGEKVFFGLQDLLLSGRSTNVSDLILFDAMKYDSIAELTVICKNGDKNTKTVELPWITEYASATGGKKVTTGFAAYHLVQLLYGVSEDDIILVNFYGNDDSSTRKCSIHAWDYEDKWLRDKNRVFI